MLHQGLALIFINAYHTYILAVRRKIISKQIWRSANSKLIPFAILFLIGVVLRHTHGKLVSHHINNEIVALIGIIIFVIFSISFLNVFTDTIRKLIAAHRLGTGRAASIQFILRVFGYIIILVSTLELLGISVGHLLLGSAVLGIIIGVAAQQALANFFASFILILSRPFTIGEHITLKSGALGGEYIGTVIDMGLTHTRLRLESGEIVYLPNATLLSSTSFIVKRGFKKSVEQEIDNKS